MRLLLYYLRLLKKYYDPDAPNMTGSDIPSALLAFSMMTILSILVGVLLGFIASYMYKHSSLSEFPTLETTLLFLFCYLCYATAEAIELSGIMALFFNGIVLSHYNKYNLSRESRHASEQIFATLATVTETIVFLYMGMGVFTGKFLNWNWKFSLYALLLCIIGRAANIFPLSWIANLCRNHDGNRIPFKMQFVLWFAGLRGAIAFALAENMPGPNRDTYATATLTICMFTTIFCGGFTERILSSFGMRQGNEAEDTDNGDFGFDRESLLTMTSPIAKRISRHVYKGFKGLWKNFDDQYLKEMFGGSINVEIGDDDSGDERRLGNYELGEQNIEEDCDDVIDLDNGSPLTIANK
jgi:sodium/hydrogen exchanger 8